MILAQEKVLEIIPHRPPFVMVDELLAASQEEIMSSFTIKEDNLLNDEGGFSFPGLIENIAQTCAAGFGYLDQQSGGEPKVGFIGAISKLTTFDRPQVGTKIETKVQIIQKLYNVILIKGISYLGEEKLIECEMKIVISE